VIFPTMTFALLYLWPAIEKRVTRDRVEHHLLDRPRDRPVRTALGAATLAFYIILFVGGGQDVIAQKLNVTITAVTLALRISLVVGPLAAAFVSYRICRDLARDKTLEAAEQEGEPPIPEQLDDDTITAPDELSPTTPVSTDA
jgi:ubiquinol-cytochrome c reductase cytochrome b subunit